tara:strand:+ start:20178 stop:21794 length:1617 start_codon:yes stop_codon:yes gene_type:complete
MMTSSPKNLDALIVGAGFSGLYMLHKLKSMNMDVLSIEEASDVGGTWYWNSYPGAQCDVESMEYSYSFSEELQQEWKWSNRFSAQPEILKYANYVSQKFDLRSNIVFNTRVTSAQYNNDTKKWLIKTNANFIYSAKFFILATGTLSSVIEPKFPGISSFNGDTYLTGKWPKTPISFKGKNVGIIGTGSSAIQSIPVIAKEAKSLTVFQRSANYSIPANNRSLTNAEVKKFKENYPSIRAKARSSQSGIASAKPGEIGAFDVTDYERKQSFEKNWNNEEGNNFNLLSLYNDIRLNEKANNELANFVRGKIQSIVKNPETAELLSPKDAIGCKRTCLDTNYFETFNRNNVSLIDVNSNPIIKITKEGLQTADKSHQFDTIIFATGFDAMTGAILSINIEGKSGSTLKNKWKNGPVTFLGLSMNNFPNLFTITGPGSPSVLSNMITSIEQHVEWITDCITFMNESNLSEIEATESSEKEWTTHVAEIAEDSPMRFACNSWYLGANIPGKTRVFMPYAGGIPKYIEKCNEVSSKDYQGFNLS